MVRGCYRVSGSLGSGYRYQGTSVRGRAEKVSVRWKTPWESEECKSISFLEVLDRVV